MSTLSKKTMKITNQRKLALRKMLPTFDNITEDRSYKISIKLGKLILDLQIFVYMS